MITTIEINGKKMVAVVLGKETDDFDIVLEDMQEALLAMMETALLPVPDDGNTLSRVDSMKLRTYVNIIRAFDGEL